jgi:RimJ/RimL family protein N-acetyltransferase
MQVTFFESERLWFRAPELADVPLITAWINDPRVRMNLDVRRFPLNQSTEEEWVRNASGPPDKAPRTDITLLFGARPDERPMGSAGLHAINWLVREAEFGILIGSPEDWNKGYGREVARRMVRYGFEELNLERIKLRVNASNMAGLKAYEAAGFVTEGRLRKAAFINGAYEDMVCMAILREEWKAD